MRIVNKGVATVMVRCQGCEDRPLMTAHKLAAHVKTHASIWGKINGVSYDTD